MIIDMQIKYIFLILRAVYSLNFFSFLNNIILINLDVNIYMSHHWLLVVAHGGV